MVANIKHKQQKSYNDMHYSDNAYYKNQNTQNHQLIMIIIIIIIKLYTYISSKTQCHK